MWTWSRLLRIAGLTLAMLVALDLALGGFEERMTRDAQAGRLRNTEARASADACLTMLRGQSALDGPEVVMVGASVTFGSNIDRDEALPAQLAALWREQGLARSVIGCAQPGGNNETPIPVAAAFGTRPVSLLMMELMVPTFAERGKKGRAPRSEEEVALLAMANSEQRAALTATDRWPRFPARIEAWFADVLRSHWRLYRYRGPLWIDEGMVPDKLVWTVRRWAARAGLLPKRFHGQTTNIGKLPWREAYVGAQRPSGAQRFVVPEARVSEREYQALLELRAIAGMAGVPVVFYELPLNLPFQRAFELMDEAELARLVALRTLLFERMRGDGLDTIEAPSLPEDAYLDKAHLTPSGARRLAEHLADALEPRLAALADPVAER
jgi:hypothetical protein